MSADRAPHANGVDELALASLSVSYRNWHQACERRERIRARWAPQEVPTGGVSPGQNLFPFDPTVFPTSTDTFTGPGYVWHCHLLGHEDHDMMHQFSVGLTPGSVDYNDPISADPAIVDSTP